MPAVLRAAFWSSSASASVRAAARRAASLTLSMAEELQQAALKTAGIHHAPGC